MKILTTKYKKIFFYQNFSDGIQKENIIINPTSDLNQSRNLKKYLNKFKIYSGNKYLIVPYLNIKKKINNLGISFGSSDPKKISIKILKFLIKMDWDIDTNLFIGFYSKFQKEIRKINVPKNIQILKFDKEKFLSSNLAICAPGVSAFELLSQNVFALYVSHSKKHFNLGKYIENNYKYSKNLATYNKLSLKKFIKYLNFFWKNKKVLKNKKLKKKINLFNNSCKRILKIVINETR